MTSIRLVPIKVGMPARSLAPLARSTHRRVDDAIEHTSEKGNAGLSKAASISQAIVTPVLQLQHEQACVAAYTGVRYADHSGPCTSKLPTHRTSPRLSGTFRAGDRPAAVHRRKRLVINSSRPFTNCQAEHVHCSLNQADCLMQSLRGRLEAPSRPPKGVGVETPLEWAPSSAGGTDPASPSSLLARAHVAVAATVDNDDDDSSRPITRPVPTEEERTRAIVTLQRFVRAKKENSGWTDLIKRLPELRRSYLDAAALAAGAADNPLYSGMALVAREALRTNPSVVAALDDAWNRCVPLGKTKMTRSLYYTFARKLYLAAVLNEAQAERELDLELIDARECMRSTEADWKADVHGKDYLTREEFHRSLFQFVDMNTNGITSDECVLPSFAWH